MVVGKWWDEPPGRLPWVSLAHERLAINGEGWKDVLLNSVKKRADGQAPALEQAGFGHMTLPDGTR